MSLLSLLLLDNPRMPQIILRFLFLASSVSYPWEQPSESHDDALASMLDLKVLQLQGLIVFNIIAIIGHCAYKL